MTDEQESVPKLMFEKSKIGSLLGVLAWAFISYNVVGWIVDFKKNHIFDLVEYKNGAFEKCVNACTYVSFGILDAASVKMEKKEVDEDREIFNEACNKKCQ